MRHNIRRLTLWLLLPTALLSACMDVSPPTAQQNEDVNSLLHSIRLPFSVAVYGLNNDDSLAVDGVLADGEVVPIDPLDVTWTVKPLSSAISIDSVGRLHVQANSSLSQTYTIIASYTAGQITRADTATIYLTSQTYDIQTFKITSLDSTSSGPMILSTLFGASLPSFRVDISDANGDAIQGAPSSKKMLVLALSDSATGRRLPLGNINALYSGSTIRWSNLNLPENKYWISVSAYLYGKPLKDSILYQSTPPAALELLVQPNGSGISIYDATIVNVVKPCALMLVYNTTSDPITWKLSKTVADQECGGALPALDGGTVPPYGFGFVTSLGYNSGQDITWTVSDENQPTSFVSGTVHIKASSN